MNLSGVVIVLLVGVTGWLAYTVIALQNRLKAQETVLTKYSGEFHAFMELKAKELQIQVAQEVEAIRNSGSKLIAAAVAQVNDKFVSMGQEVDQKLVGMSDGVKAEAEKVKVAAKGILESQLEDFKVLMKNAYLDQYEKMRKNPPRPKKGPRKTVDPPSKYRSLDDE